MNASINKIQDLHQHLNMNRCNGELRLPRFKTPLVLINW